MEEINVLLSIYDCVVITIEHNKVIATPCDDAMSGYYPIYKNRVTLCENAKYSMVIESKKVDGILLTIEDGEIKVNPVEDSHDGYQIID